MNPVSGRLRRDLRDRSYRHTYDDGFLDSSIATQIRVLREQRAWTQAHLATEARMNQSRISELEDVNYSSWSVRTLRRLAHAFDVRLKITFEEFGSLLRDVTKLNRESLQRRPFSEDPAFQIAATASESMSETAKLVTMDMPQGKFGTAASSFPTPVVCDLAVSSICIKKAAASETATSQPKIRMEALRHGS